MLELTTPSVKSDNRLAAEFRPRKLEEWLAQLPTMDRSACLRQLQRALTAQNRVALPPEMRVQLMELYLVPFQDIYASHHSDLRSISRVPLHPHYRARQQEMLAMLEELAAGYKLAVLDLAAQRTGHGRETNLALAVQRAMYCLGEVLVTACELYTRPPADRWRELHQLYRCAEAEDMLTTEVTPVQGLLAPRNALRTYLSVVLVGASSPLSLLPGEVRRLYDLTPQWYSSAKITDGSEMPTRPGHFLIHLTSDAPPVPLSKSSGSVDSDTRILRALGVARAMHEALTEMNDATTLKAISRVLGANIDATDTGLFRRAGRVLGEVDIKRSSTRQTIEQRLEFCSGFNAVYSACNGGRPFDPSTSEQDEATESEPHAGQAAEQFIDLSEPMLGMRVDDPDSRAHEAGDRPAIRADCVNQGAGGLCLVVPRRDGVQPKVGDVVGCRFSGSSDWQLGVARWLRAGSREVRLGIQFLAPVAVPVVVKGKAAASTPVAAIWLPENSVLKQPNSIVLPWPAEPYPSELEIVVRESRVPQRVRLLGRVERTGDYERFLVSVESPASGSQSSLSS